MESCLRDRKNLLLWRQSNASCAPRQGEIVCMKDTTSFHDWEAKLGHGEVPTDGKYSEF